MSVMPTKLLLKLRSRVTSFGQVRSDGAAARSRRRAIVLRSTHAVVLVLLCLGVYSNGFEHAFHLDSSHVIVENIEVRDLSNIPEFFTNPGTFTPLRANVDYRPVLQITYAINYWMGGYEMWWWHLTQVLLHAVCVLGLYALCVRVLERSGHDDAGDATAWLAFFAAAVFALHPTASGVVNYISARSSLLTAAFLLWAIVAYMRPRRETEYAKTMWITAALFALAIFSKVEAVGCLAVFFLYDVWQTARRRGHASGFVSDVLESFNRTVLRRLWPTLVVALVYFVIRSVVMADFDLANTGRRHDVSALEYFLTQTVAWWYYIRHWFIPIDLVADQGAYPIYRSLFDGTLLLALGAWMLVGASLVSQWRKRPYLLFLALSSLALISPTSSIVPLAEMVNEHRPYLPIAVLSLSWMIPVGLAVRDRLGRGWMVRSACAVGFLTVLVGLGVLTFERNRVFATSESYWADVVRKAPSFRAHMNYGLVFMNRGDYETALGHFERSLELAPYWHWNHINMGIAYQALGDDAMALEHFDKAVEYDHFSGTALIWRGNHYLKHARYAEALADFEGNLGQSLRYYSNYKGLATASAGLGDARKCFEYTSQCLEIDPAQVGIDIVEIARPYFLDAKLYEPGLEFFRLLEADLPETWWVYANMGTLAQRLGQTELAEACRARSRELKAAPSE